MKSELHLSVSLFNIRKEYTTATAKPSPDPLNAPAAIDYCLVVPLDLEHPPVLLDGNRCIPFLLSVLLGLTTSWLLVHYFT
jgi:hypothetical protein